MPTEPSNKPVKTETKTPRVRKTAVKKVVKDATTAVVTTEVAVAAPLDRSAYLSGLGRRKTAIAQVRLVKSGSGAITVNNKPFDQYFTTFELRNTVTSPLKTTGLETAVDVIAKVLGGGTRGQADAVRLGITRALVELNPTYRKTLKKLGYLTRDPRAKERKKFGLKRARRAPQWSKR